MKVSRSLKLMRGAGLRTRKLARDMLVFWKRVDREMVLCFLIYFSYVIVGLLFFTLARSGENISFKNE